MKSLIAVYDSHDSAIDSVKKLIESGFSRKHISLITKAEESEKHMALKSSKNIEAAELSVGAIAGPVVGILSGIGLFSIPGFGFLFGAGALVGALAGFDFGLIAGGIASFLTMVGVNMENHAIYQNHLQEGSYLLVFQSDEDDLKKAEEVLRKAGNYNNISFH